MLPERDLGALQDMLAYARALVAAVATRSRDDVEQDWLSRNGLERALEVIGEAAARVSPQTRGLYPQIAWRPVIDMRNRLIHGYDTSDRDVVWDTITEDLPVLIPQLEAILGNVE